MQGRKIFTPAATIAFAAFIMVSIGARAAKAEDESEHGAQGYVFFAPGAAIFESGYYRGTAHFGVGGESLMYKGIGVGVEIGYLTPWKDFSTGIGIASIDGSYHFLRHRKVSPFISGGYSLGFRSGFANLANFGAGLNWWVSNRMGLHLEFRDHVYCDTGFSGEHYLGGRIAFAFR